MTGNSAPEASSVPPAASTPEADLTQLRAQIEELQVQLAAAKEGQLRVLADLDNMRKRAEREVSNASRYGSEKLLGELIGVADSLDLGLAAAAKPEVQAASLTEGMDLTRKQFLSVLEKHGVTPVDPAGQPFNPDLHEAVSMVPSADVPPNHVLNVMQKGYRLHDRLLRPAMVIVARAPDPAA